MQNLVKTLTVAIIVLLSITSCGKNDLVPEYPEDSLPQGPKINVPGGTQIFAPGQSKELVFLVHSPGGFQAASVQSSSNGTFEISETPNTGDITGEIKGWFTAGVQTGQGTLSITVNDENSKSASDEVSTLVINQ